MAEHLLLEHLKTVLLRQLNETRLKTQRIESILLPVLIDLRQQRLTIEGDIGGPLFLGLRRDCCQGHQQHYQQ